MGKKLDALLGRSFKTSKFKGTAALAVSRLAVLKNQRQARCSVARSDVVDLLNNGSHDRALLRVEQVIKEQNMLDVFVVLEGYCHLLLERVNLFEHEKFCPEELVEAVSTLIYASTRCGDFPELQELRAICTSKFGKEFAARAVELRNNCGVNPRIIQKLSTRTPSLETKFKVLKEIASDHNIEIPESVTEPENPSEEKVGSSEVHNQEERESSVRRKYRDVADAAQAAFESAAYAAAAARIAVELSRSESADLTTPSTPRERISAEFLHQDAVAVAFAKGTEEMKPNEAKTLLRRSFSASSSDSSDDEGDAKGKNVEFVERNWDAIDSEFGEKRSEEGVITVEPLDISRRPISVRTTWARVR